MRHAAWLITHFQIKGDGKTPRERLRNRAYHGEFAETVHHKDLAKDMGRTTSGTLESGSGRACRQTSTTLAPVLESSDAGRPGGAQKRHGGWANRWTSFFRTPCAPTPSIDAVRTPQPRSVFITFVRHLKNGGTKRCLAHFGHAKVHSAEGRARFETLLSEEQLANVQSGGAAAREAQASP